MKRALIFSGCFFIALLGSSYYSEQGKKSLLQSQKPKTSVTKPAAKSIASKQEMAQGKLLIAKSDCSACHKPKEQAVGPSYADIAKKYALTEANVNLLAQRVIKGSIGVWDQTPMSPHPSIAVTDAKKIVKYILTEFK